MIPGRNSLVAVLGLMALLIGCDDKPKQVEAVRSVRTVVVERRDLVETLSEVGEIQARYETDLGFRIGGKVIARPVDVGTQVTAGTLLASLDDQPKQNQLRSAQAAVTAAEAEVTRTEAEEARAKVLIQQGFATKEHYDTALRDLQTSQAQLDSMRAQLKLAEDGVSYTELRAETDGIVSAVYIDAGQVVTAGQKVMRLAQPGEREAVFNVPDTVFDKVPRDVSVEVSLVSNPAIKARGSPRYVSPEADPTTRSFLVRISLPDAPPEMRLGSTVEGRVALPTRDVVELPGAALFEDAGKPAVWLFDAASGTVRLTAVTVLRYDSSRVVISDGLQNGDVVVTAGVHLLRPGERVRLLAAAQ
jgi:RND family efflux transporter MFP subunit